MAKKIFYDHLIKIEELTVFLDDQEIMVEEKEELISIIDQTFHHHILNTILSCLPQDKHDKFLSRFQEAPCDPELLDFLKEQVEIDIEEAIRTQAEKIKKELLAEIKRAKR